MNPDNFELSTCETQKKIDKINNLNKEEQYIYWQQKTEVLRKKQQYIRRQNLNDGKILPLLEPTFNEPKCKIFDCVEMKYKAVQSIFEKISSMKTIEEELHYWQESTETLKTSQQAFRRLKNK